MLGRFVLLAACASIGTAAFAVPPVSESSAPAERLRVSCTGTMMTAGQPPPGGPIIANGLIDFAGQRVSGFGVGSQPIVVLTASHIAFGTSPSEGARRGNIVEGSIDRRTGETRVLVRSPQDPSKVRIEETLDCEFEPPVS